MAECALFGTYSFTNVALSIDGVLVTGLDEGDDAISVEPGSDLGTRRSARMAAPSCRSRRTSLRP